MILLLNPAIYSWHSIYNFVLILNMKTVLIKLLPFRPAFSCQFTQVMGIDGVNFEDRFQL
jgi:hypothetical protein